MPIAAVRVYGVTVLGTEAWLARVRTTLILADISASECTALQVRVVDGADLITAVVDFGCGLEIVAYSPVNSRGAQARSIHVVQRLVVGVDVIHLSRVAMGTGHAVVEQRTWVARARRAGFSELGSRASGCREPAVLRVAFVQDGRSEYHHPVRVASRSAAYRWTCRRNGGLGSPQ